MRITRSKTREMAALLNACVSASEPAPDSSKDAQVEVLQEEQLKKALRVAQVR